MKLQDEYRAIYIQEADELLQQMNKYLLIFENDYNNIEAINSIFRFAHTMKSMSASMNYTAIANLSHRMEDLLEEIRQKRIKTSERIIEILFNTFDNLDKMISDIHESNNTKINIEPILSAIDKVLKNGSQTTKRSTAKVTSLLKAEEDLFLEATKDNIPAYKLEITLEQSCQLKGVRAFMVLRNLNSIGRVVKTFPDTEAINDERFGFEFESLFISREPGETIRNKIMEVLEVRAVNISNYSVPAHELSPEDALDDADFKIDSSIDGGLRKITSVRVDISKLDKLMNLIEELSISQLKLANISKRLSSSELFSVNEDLSRLVDELQNEIMEVRLVPVHHIFNRFPRLVRDIAKKEGKGVKFSIMGGDVELDRTILDEIGDPLIHLLKNAIDHGIESSEVRSKIGKTPDGRIELSAIRDKNHVIISISDDGKGMDIEEIKRIAVQKNFVSKNRLSLMTIDEILFLATKPGFSTATKITDVSGRGVGLDVAREKTQGIGGQLSITTNAGSGTTISMRFPITTAVFNALLVKIDERIYAIAVANIIEISKIQNRDIKTIDGRETFLSRGQIIPIFRVNYLFNGESGNSDYTYSAKLDFEKKQVYVVIVESLNKRYALLVEKLIGQQEIVIKQLSKELRTIRGFSGATILGDGNLALVLDIDTLI